MHRSIKSTLSLLIALAPVARASAIGSEVTRTGRPPLTQPANICSLGPVLPCYPRTHSLWIESPRWWEKEDKMLGWTFFLFSRTDRRFTALKVRVRWINQWSEREKRTAGVGREGGMGKAEKGAGEGEGGGEEMMKMLVGRLACEHSSMTSSTTELLDLMHTRPGTKPDKEVRLRGHH